jgi:hypothetical protein
MTAIQELRGSLKKAFKSSATSSSSVRSNLPAVLTVALGHSPSLLGAPSLASLALRGTTGGDLLRAAPLSSGG